MLPILKYAGGKRRELPYILPHIPQYTGRYIEPFFGGGALYFHLEPQNAIINDLNPSLIDFYTSVRNNYSQLRTDLEQIKELYDACHNMTDKSKLYSQLRNAYNHTLNTDNSNSNVRLDKLCQSSLYYCMNKLSFSGLMRYNSKGEYNVSFGQRKTLNISFVSEKHSSLLQKSAIYNLDYQKIFDLIQPEDFVFLDPPYDCIYTDYGNQQYQSTGFTREDQEVLAQAIKSLSCKWLLVINKTPLTEHLYKDLIISEYNKNYAIKIKNRINNAAVHLIVSNI